MQPETKTEPEPETQLPLEEVIAEVRADSKRAPDAYAKETIVPEGGE